MKKILLISILLIKYIPLSYCIPTEKVDTNYVNHLNELCLQNEFSNNNLAKTYCQKALTAAQKIGYKKGEAKAIVLKGYLQEDVGEYQAAVNNYSQALAIYYAIGYKKGIAECYNNIGNAQNALGHVPEAMYHYNEAKKLFESINFKPGLASAYNNLAIINGDQGNYPEALINFFNSLKCRDELTEKDDVAKTYNNIGNVYIKLENYSEALKYQTKALAIRNELKDSLGIATLYSNIGISYSNQNKFLEAESNCLLALNIAKPLNAKQLVANCFTNLGLIDKKQNKLSPALEYYKSALNIYQEINNKNGIATAYLNIGNCFGQQHNIKDAYTYLNLALNIAKELGSKEKLKDCYSNLSFLDSASSNYKDAYSHHKLFIAYRDSIINEEILKRTQLVKNNYDLSKKQLEQEKEKKLDEIKNTTQRKLLYVFIICFFILVLIAVLIVNYYRAKLKNLSTNIVDAPEIVVRKMSIVILSIATCFASIIWAWLYYFFYGMQLATLGPILYFLVITPCVIVFFISKKESLLVNIQLVSIFAFPVYMEWTSGGFESGIVINWSILAPIGALMYKSIRTALWWMIAFVVAVICTLLFNDMLVHIAAPISFFGQSLLYCMNIIGPAIVIYFSMQFYVKSIIRDGKLLQESNNTISIALNDLSIEKEKSEKLLLNILPEEIATELKMKGEIEAKLFNDVSVLFTDFVGFSLISEKLSPKELVAEIHFYFKAFDAIIEKHGLEKIKTIGDAYLAVCGLPNQVENHAQKTIEAAIEIIDFTKKRKKEGGLFDIRIGINSGSLVAGIVGVKKFSYDVWGDTVNIAARMEQSGQPGRINISTSTFQLIKNDFNCLYRGKITAKNKGELDMYFIEGL
jgi:class 3 adenylate cyclase/tetratricopeptide (TPR) repeat protein